MSNTTSPETKPAILCVNSRNGIELINLAKVVYLKADGNYTHFITSDGKTRTLLSNLAHFETEVYAVYANAQIENPYLRITRSYMINTDYVTNVNLGTQTVAFFVDAVKPLSISKKLLKALQTYIYEKYANSTKPLTH